MPHKKRLFYDLVELLTLLHKKHLWVQPYYAQIHFETEFLITHLSLHNIQFIMYYIFKIETVKEVSSF